ncbi:anti-sigma factor [Aquiflexum lacus]|uniref:anti-sigma factor n=1 Tax=Aquiflexum lacus TaxID=2483805 RepID=UPI00189427F3|nr:anti-sigma factor [Aquiflexum lacus]
MDIQAYISSGKLELFVLGELSERERDEVIQLAKQYPEIQLELDQIEEAFFQFDNQAGINPSSSVKKKIFESLDQGMAESPEVVLTASKEEVTTKTISIQPWKAYFAAASIVALLASAVAIYFAMQYNDVDKRFAALLQEQSVLAEEMNQYKVNFEEADAQLEILLAGNYERIPMKGEGFEMQKDAAVDVWWDKGSASVFVSVNNLSGLEEQYDYQLWAIGEQGPIGIGLVDAGQKFSLQQMQAVASAGAFAITVEPKGGSESPTLEKLVVLGNVV